MKFFKCPTCRPVAILSRVAILKSVQSITDEIVEFCPECQGPVEDSEGPPPEGYRRLDERYAAYDVCAWVRETVRDRPSREVDHD